MPDWFQHGHALDHVLAEFDVYPGDFANDKRKMKVFAKWQMINGSINL